MAPTLQKYIFIKNVTKSTAAAALKNGNEVYANFKVGAQFVNLNAPTFEQMRLTSIGNKYVTTMTAQGKVLIELVESYELG